ncbi:hypothetical protein N0O83_38810, partial [Streptomyces atratus]|nr:hypothetical protein [Streptomyces atratus]
MEPYVQLALTMRPLPGGYAVLLGAGASITAGMPSAWEVQQDLIGRIAAVEGATEIGDPHTWYKEKFGHEATYDGLLVASFTSSDSVCRSVSAAVGARRRGGCSREMTALRLGVSACRST